MQCNWGQEITVISAIRAKCNKSNSESRQDQKEGGELDSHKEVRHFCGSKRDQGVGGELDSHEEVRHFCRSRWWTLKLAQKRSRAGRWSWAQKVGLLLLQLLLNNSAMDIVLVTLLCTTIETAIV